MIQSFIWVALGGAGGAVVRFGISRMMEMYRFSGLPWATLTVNLVGCLLAGFLSVWLTRSNQEDAFRQLLVVGFCGGFTTFSAFGLENLKLINEGRMPEAIIYSLISLMVGIALVYLGAWFGRTL